MRILTVDVEDWFHILDNAETESEDTWQSFPSRVEAETERLLDLFDSHDQKATFFILGWVARNHPDLIAEIARRGHKIKCFPISLGQFAGKSFVFSGGGYFRIAPKFLLRRWFARPDYLMTYFHPRDFDGDQPVVPGLSKARHFKSYVGLQGAFSKLDTLMRGNAFMALRKASELAAWVQMSFENVVQPVGKPPEMEVVS